MPERFIRGQVNLPDPPSDPDELPNYIRQHLIPAIVEAFRNLARPFPAAYTVSNLTEDRTYDAAATTVGELANVLGTLLTDMQRRGDIV